MSPGRSVSTFVVVFAAAYAVIYVIAMEYNWALFTYHPASAEFHVLVKPAVNAPAMYWYGWIATSGLGALVVAGVAAVLPAAWTARLWSGWSWLAPLLGIVVLGYLLRGFFLR